MLAGSRARATIDDLYRVDGKAELIAGRIVRFPPSGFLPSQVASRILRSLDDHAEATGRGVAFTGSLAYAVPILSSGRESFSPNVSYYVGPLPTNPMRFIEGPPTFAVEVRGEGDHGPSAEDEMAAKRGDYFEAGTLVVWDVDPLAATVAAYRANAPMRPDILSTGQEADAGPAVPGWRMAVDVIFRK